ncbi:MAG TPA: cobalamin-binding protein [Burkholderiaceae bacterium]|nr:cobalamin-binding protein [Burkholderiaceae bacterium]
MRCLLLLVLAACALPARADIALRDDSGAEVRLKEPARRIVSLAPHITEILFAAGAGDRVVGTVQYSDYPQAASRIARIGGYENVDLEAILALRPDLVIAWQTGNSPSDLELLKRRGIPLYLSEPDRIEDVAGNLEQFGRLAGTSSAAAPAAQAYRARLAELRQRYSSRAQVRTFYQIWGDPPITVGGSQIIGSAIRLCGGVNIFGHLTPMAPTVSVEAVLAANPEVIVASGADATRPDWLDAWRRWPQLIAAARDNLFFIAPDLIQRHTPRLLDGAEQLCRDLETARQRRPAGRESATRSVPAGAPSVQ